MRTGRQYRLVVRSRMTSTVQKAFQPIVVLIVVVEEIPQPFVLVLHATSQFVESAAPSLRASTAATAARSSRTPCK